MIAIEINLTFNEASWERIIINRLSVIINEDWKVINDVYRALREHAQSDAHCIDI